MASLHKVPKSPCWYCAFRLANGRRTLQSTGEVDKRRAKIKCDAMQRLNEEAGREDTDRRFLERILADALRRLGHSGGSEPSLEKWLTDWIQNQKTSVALPSFKKYALAVRLFLGSVNGAKRLIDVNSSDCQRWLDGLVRSGRRPATVNLMRSIIRIPLKLAFDSGLVQRNPMALVKPVKRSQVQKGTFSPAQIQSILSVCDDEWKGLVLAGWFTGQRLGDLARLKWSDVCSGSHLTIRQGKTGNQVQIPLHPELAEWLNHARVQHLKSTAAVDLNQQGKLIRGSNLKCATVAHLNQQGKLAPGAVFPILSLKPIPELSRRFGMLLALAGIERALIRERSGGKSRSLSGLSFHSLRHSFNSALSNAGVPIEVRQKLTGHASVEMNLHYSHNNLSVLQEAISRLPSIKPN
jgi:integrase